MSDDRTSWADSLLVRRALCGLAALGSLGLLLATFLPVLRLSSGDPSALRGEATSYTGLDRHSISLILIALVALPATLLAVRGMRTATLAVLLCALAALLIAVGFDAPDLHSGILGADLAPAKATAGPGYYLETLGGVLLLFSAGGLAALQARPGPKAEPSPSEG